MTDAPPLRELSPEVTEGAAAVFDFELDADDLAEIERLDRKDGRLGGDPMTANY